MPYPENHSDLDIFLGRLDWLRDVEPNVRSVVHAISTGTLSYSDKDLVHCTNEFFEKGRSIYWLREPAAHLVQHAISQRKDISEEQIYIWIEELSERGLHQEVARCVETFFRRPMHPAPQMILRWASNAMSLYSHQNYKPAALILIHGKCTTSKHLSTTLACKWLLQSVEYYEGDHGVARFLHFVTVRLRYMRVGSVAHSMVIGCVADALFAIRSDPSIFQILCGRTRALVRTSDWQDISTHVATLLAIDSAQRFEMVAKQIASLTEPTV